MDQDAAKRQAAQAALREVQSGMALGLGTGSTAKIFVDLLIERVKRENLKITAIATSEATEKQARAGGIHFTDFAHCPALDITFDGADVADLKSFALLKGLGGALLREKIVAQASRRLVIMVDRGKVPAAFGGTLPVEIVRFAHEATFARLQRFGAATLRLDKQTGQTFITDGGNYIVDIICPAIENPANLQGEIKAIAGVIETGLFIGMASAIIIGDEAGAEIRRPAQP